MPITKATVRSHNEAIDRFVSSDHVAVVPNSRWADEINLRLLSRAQDNCLMGQRVCPLRDFIRANSLTTCPVVTRSVQKLLVKEAAQKATLSYFKGLSQGVVASILHAILELKKNRISPEELHDILNYRGGKKEADLLSIYSKYNDGLSMRGWIDEESLAPESFGDINLSLIGFDEPPPQISDAVYYAVAPDVKNVPQMFSFPSPFAETRHVAKRIMELNAQGVLPERIGVYLKDGDPFILDLCRALGFTDSPFNLLQSHISKNIFGGIIQSATIEEHCERAAGAISSIDTDIKANTQIKARTLLYIEQMHAILKKMIFEFHLIEHDSIIDGDDFATALKAEILNIFYHQRDLPFRPVFWEDAGLYKLDKALLPRLMDGYMPSTSSSIRFFTEPDTLSVAPNEKIGKIFISQEEAIRRELTRFELATSAPAEITFPIYTSMGKESSPSLFIAKYEPVFIVDEPSAGVVINTTCGTDFSVGEALEKLRKDVHERIFSPTKLEDYGACPFAFFCRHILGLEPNKEKTPDVQPKDRGTLIHEILEQFFITNGNIYTNAITERGREGEISRLAAKTCDEVFVHRDDIIKKYHPDMVRYFKDRCTILITSVLTSELEYLRGIRTHPRPTRFELKFEDNIDEGIKIRGVIDRIDEDDESFSVIDYKTGRTDPVNSGIREGIELQMPLYTEMARRILHKEPSSAFLYSVPMRKRASGIVRSSYKDNIIPEGTRSRLVVKDAEWDELIALGIKTACEYVQRIRDGKFLSAPDKCSVYCDWEDACRYKP